MAKNSIRDFSATAGSNTDIQSVDIDENCAASGLNNAIRELMADIADFNSGAVGIDVLSLADDDNSAQIKIQAPSAVTTTTTFTLPDGDGSSGQFLKTDGAGALSFATVATDLSGDTTPQLSGVLDTNGNNIEFPDSSGAEVNRLKFGSGDDLSIYHDGTNSVISDGGSGDLNLSTNGTAISILGNGGSEFMGYFKSNAEVQLFHNNSKKFETTSGGVDITGSLGFDSYGSVPAGTVLQTVFLDHRQTSQVTKSGSESELDTDLRLSITPKKSNSKLILRFYTCGACRNSNNLLFGRFRDVTANSYVNVPTGSGNRSGRHWAMRQRSFDNNDYFEFNMTTTVSASTTNARTYTIFFGTEGVTCEFFSSTLNNSAGTNWPAVFIIQEIAQ